MDFLTQTNIIKKYNCSILVSEKNEGHLNICKVECVSNKRNNNWTHLFPSIYADYAMLHEKYLIDLPGRNFLVYQINEHSRGGHTEFEMQLMDLQGKVLNQFSSRYNSKLICDDKYIWLIKSGDKPFKIGSDRDLDLVKTNHKTGKIKQTIKLNYPHLLKCDYNYVIDVEFTKKHNSINLLIKYSNDEKVIKSKRLALTEI